MNPEIRGCKPRELPDIIQRLDQEFVYNKQRSHSLSKRFPNILSLANIEQIRVAVSNGEICGAYVIKLFNWIVEKRVWRGAMVGMVWVDLQYRGMGIGLNLLSSAKQFLLKKGLDFGVLWTGTPKFYEHAGWYSNDCGLFGEVVKRTSLSIDRVSCRPLISMGAAMLEHLRSSSIPKRIVRNLSDYRTIPIPADHVLCFYAKNDDGRKGFALVGEKDHTGYFYEMVAPPDLWHRIWSAVTKHFGNIFVNGCKGDPFTQWLVENRFVIWQPQNKTMWLRLSDRIEDISINDWHIPYFDWI